MYNQLKWEDRVTEFDDLYTEENANGHIRHTPYEGAIICAGTPQSAKNFNNNEEGTQDVTVATQLLAFWSLQNQRRDDDHQNLMDSEVLGEQKKITLNNTAKFPFNSTIDTPETVNLSKTRKNLFYSVETEIESHTGEVGEIVITKKATNGFKIGFNGSGTKAVVIVRVKGGMT